MQPHRRLTPFSEKAQVEIPGEVIKRRVRLKHLVSSAAYQDLKDVAGELVTTYGAPIPTNPLAIVGFVTFSIVRDVMNEFFARIEKDASLAPEQDAT